MSLKRILAGILSASLVLTVALSGCNNGQSGSADPSSSTGGGHYRGFCRRERGHRG